MSEILVVYRAEPFFPATDQHPDAVRYQVSGLWVDAIGGQPSDDAVRARTFPFDLKAYAADWRWRAEIGGCLDPAGRRIATDRESQTKLIAEMVALSAGLRADPSLWKLADGSFAVLTNTEMLAAIMAARTHIAASFATESAVVAAIAAGTITTKAQIDAANWPGSV